MFRLPDDFDKPEFSSVTIQRDLFYGYDTLMENVSDPSHIDFAHHKVQTEFHWLQAVSSVSDGNFIRAIPAWVKTVLICI